VENFSSLLVQMQLHRGTDVPNLRNPSSILYHVWHRAKWMGNHTEPCWFCLAAVSEQQGITVAVLCSGDDVDLKLQNNVF